MPVVIGQIVTETVVSAESGDGATHPTAGMGDDAMETVVRRATERVLETLRREWDR